VTDPDKLAPTEPLTDPEKLADTAAVTGPDSYGDTAAASDAEIAAATTTLGQPPAAIGAYKVLSVIGHGGMGVVYRARHRSASMAARQGGDVAIKVMHRHYAADEGFQERFEREASLGLRLEHPGLVRTFDLVVDRGVLALVMEVVEGQALGELLAERGPLPVAEAASLVRQMAEAVECAHEVGVVHRDIKPDNVIIQPGGTLKILDFGIAKDPDGKGRTRTGTGMGTIDYMAPEQYTDARSVDRRADIYALGMVAYRILAGRLPWGGRQDVSEFSVMMKKVEGRLPPPDTHGMPVPSPVSAVVMQALAVKPEARPATATEFARLLDEASRASTAPPLVVSQAPAAPPPPPPPESGPTEPEASLPAEAHERERRSLIPTFFLGFGGVITLAACGLGGLIVLIIALASLAE
jgi:eukaryotic-like serine/threonine-protein kinase